MLLRDKNILVGVTGSIAKRFIAPLTFETISQNSIGKFFLKEGPKTREQNR